MAIPSPAGKSSRQRIIETRHELTYAASRMEKTGRGPSKRGGKGATSTPGGSKARFGSRAKG